MMQSTNKHFKSPSLILGSQVAFLTLPHDLSNIILNLDETEEFVNVYTSLRGKHGNDLHKAIHEEERDDMILSINSVPTVKSFLFSSELILNESPHFHVSCLLSLTDHAFHKAKDLFNRQVKFPIDMRTVEGLLKEHDRIIRLTKSSGLPLFLIDVDVRGNFSIPDDFCQFIKSSIPTVSNDVKMQSEVLIPLNIDLPDSVDLVAVIGPSGAGKTTLGANITKVVDLDQDGDHVKIHHLIRGKYGKMWYNNPNAVQFWNVTWPRVMTLNYKKGTVVVTADVPIIWHKRVTHIILFVPSPEDMFQHHNNLDPDHRKYISHFTVDQHKAHNQVYLDIVNYNDHNKFIKTATTIPEVISILQNLK